MMFSLRYLLNVLVLFVRRRISWQTLRHALHAHPAAVAGRGGSYIVEPDLEV